jgi:hypothetical protein
MVKIAVILLLLSNSVNAFTGVDIDGDKFEYKNNMMFSKKPIVKAWVGDIFGGHHIHTFIAKLEKKHGTVPSRHALRVHVPSRPSNTVKRNSIRIASSNQLHRDQVRSVKGNKPESSRRS